MTTEPTLRILSLGAGVQSTTLMLLAANGKLPKLDAAIFADTGDEPARVYEHLDRLEAEVATPAGIPIYRVAYGTLSDDLLDPNRMAMIPAYTLGQPQEVKVATAYEPCTCEWTQFRKLGYHELEAGELFPMLKPEIDFDDFSLLPEQATVADVEAVAAEAVAESDRELRGGADQDDLGDLDYREQAARQIAQAMRDLGMERLPARHEDCKSLGRIVTAWRTEVTQSKGMLGRKCTQTYKLRPLLEQVRLMLGATVTVSPCRHCDGTGMRVAPWRAKRGETEPGPCSVCRGRAVTRLVNQPPAGASAEQWIGFSTDEFMRVSDRGDTRYSKSRYPLLELGMSREQCITYLNHHGWTSVAKSACVFCPYRGNAEWRQMRDTDPGSWKQAVAFDEAYRTGPGMNSERYLHITCLPLAEAPVDRPRPIDQQQGDIFDEAFTTRLEEGDPDGCSPWGCRSGEAVG